MLYANYQFFVINYRNGLFTEQNNIYKYANVIGWKSNGESRANIKHEIKKTIENIRQNQHSHGEPSKLCKNSSFFI